MPFCMSALSGQNHKKYIAEREEYRAKHPENEEFYCAKTQQQRGASDGAGRTRAVVAGG